MFCGQAASVDIALRTPTPEDLERPSGRRIPLLLAVVATLVLAGAGTTVALLNTDAETPAVHALDTESQDDKDMATETRTEEKSSAAISQDAALQARADAGCETIANEEPVADSTHHEIASAPAADAMYGTTVRPNHSGPHYSSYSEPFGGAPRDPADERSLTHNLEHGAIIVWVDEAIAGDGVLGEVEDWVRSRMDMGYTSTGGGHIFVSKYNGITSGKPIALRAWGVAVDCDEWSPLFADSFVIDYFGTHGNAPERPLSPYPENALHFGPDPS